MVVILIVPVKVPLKDPSNTNITGYEWYWAASEFTSSHFSIALPISASKEVAF